MTSQDIPREIVEVIFHFGCSLSQRFSQTLCQICVWTRRLALPYLYSTVILKSQASIVTFHSNIIRGDAVLAPPARSQIRRLWMEPASDRIIEIVESLKDLDHLALHEENLIWLQVRDTFGQSHSRRKPSTTPLSSNHHADFHLWITRARSPRWALNATLMLNEPTAFLSKVTHLRLCVPGFDILSSISNLPRLTHLAISYDGSREEDLKTFVANLNSVWIGDLLLVIVMVVDQSTSPQSASILHWISTLDTRHKIHILASQRGNARVEWEEEVNYGLSFWKKAELQSYELFGGRLKI